MSEYLAKLYGPVIDELLARFHLEIPASARDMLTGTLVFARCEATPRSEGSRSPVPSAAKALAHAEKVLGHMRKRPIRSASLPKRATSLRAALLGSEILALELSFHLKLQPDEYGDFLDALRNGKPDEAVLLQVIEALQQVSGPDRTWQSVGRPISRTTTLIRTACIAWIRAERPVRFSWDESAERLDGQLPDFIRGLLRCCNGTDLAVARVEARRPEMPGQRKAGQGIRMSDGAIRMALLACKKDGLINIQDGPALP
jgi:hypothetical protein